MSEYKDLDAAALHDPSVRAWTDLARMGGLSRVEALEGLCLSLANEKARLLAELLSMKARELPQPIVDADGNVWRYTPSASGEEE